MSVTPEELRQAAMVLEQAYPIYQASLLEPGENTYFVVSASDLCRLANHLEEEQNPKTTIKVVEDRIHGELTVYVGLPNGNKQAVHIAPGKYQGKGYHTQEIIVPARGGEVVWTNE